MKSLAIRGMVLLVVALAFALPAGAAPPEELSVTAVVEFDVSSGTMHGTGPWFSEGFIDGSGIAQEDHFVAGWPPGYIFKTAHTTETWEDEYGTITIQGQVNVDEWTINAFPCDASFKGNGNWVIKSGTGVYENIHGQGTVTVEGEITPDSCPNLIVQEFYVGRAHIEP